MTKTVQQIRNDYDFQDPGEITTDLINYIEFSKKIQSVNDTSVNFSSFLDAASVQYSFSNWNPSSQPDGVVRFSAVFENNYIGAYNGINNAHHGGVLGIGRNNVAGKNMPLSIGVEGRGGVLEGTSDIAAGLVGALDTVSENNGTAPVGAQCYLPAYTAAQLAHYTAPYKLFAAGDEIDSRIDGRLLLGMGKASARSVSIGLANSDTGVVGNVGAGEDDLHTYSLPANALSADGKAIRFKGTGYVANNANAKTLKIYFGATLVLTAALPTSALASYDFEMTVVRESAGQQRAVARVLVNGANPIVGVASPTETESGAITIKSTGEATADNDVTELFAMTEFMN